MKRWRGGEAQGQRRKARSERQEARSEKREVRGERREVSGELETTNIQVFMIQVAKR